MHCMYERAKKKMIDMIKALQFVSLTTDTWTSRNNAGFIAVSAHGISDDWKLKEYIIAVQHIEVYCNAYTCHKPSPEV